MDNIKIGKYIKTLRKNKNMTQKELADELCVSFQAVSKWEIGETLPDTSLLLKLCDILDTSVDKLLNGGAIVMNENKMIKVENIVEGFNSIENVKKCFGEHSTFYKGMVQGINNLMNIDFEEALEKYKEVLYTEVIIQYILNGYKVDLDEVRKYITKEHLINEITKRMK